jgi:sarcosine oxidase, subunit gamma
MSNYRATLRSALAAKKAVASSAINLSPLPEVSIIHVHARPGETDLAPLMNELGGGRAHAVRPVAPGQWFIVGDRQMSHEETKTVLEALEPRASGVDQSHGRVRMRVQGKMAERALSKGTGLDLWASAFPIGQSATTLIGHIASHITRLDRDVFEIIVLRGFAESLWDDLARMSAEFA